MWALGVIIFTLLCGHLPFDQPVRENLWGAIMCNDYQFLPNTIWDYISDQCKDVIESLLEPNLEKRLTPTEALKMPWFESERCEARQNRQGLVKNSCKIAYNLL